tara:strand:- start:1247 stop:1525 length:279 start_codon:yes stop_codon:yes gene_type:complete
MFLYARKAISVLMTASEELGDLQQMIDSFSSHLASIYEMDMFYGDETLRGLMEHANSFVEQMETFNYVYQLSENPADEAEAEEIETEIEVQA